MIFVYNFLQCILLALTFPLLLLLVLGRDKYRGRILAKLGFGLPRSVCDMSRRIWIHCLSVGEVTSAIPLVKEIRRQMPDACLILTVSTATGLKIARIKAAPHVDLVLSGPVDFLPTINRFINIMQPDIFILIETDFWPNWLAALRRRKIPAVLVNGRISSSSYRNYRRFRYFFAPLFRCFSLLCMQTSVDAKQMQTLGIPEERLLVLGNLKYDTGIASDIDQPADPLSLTPYLPAAAPIWICGSTHPGEEEILLAAFAGLRKTFPNLTMIMAPRDPGRGRAITALAEQMELTAVLRTAAQPKPAAVLILDTIGELTASYQLARIAFIGGSLVPCGGHNPLEAAVYGVPTLFGPHMEDFQEIARDLVHCGAAAVVSSGREIQEWVTRLLDDEAIHAGMSRAAGDLIARNKGITRQHAEHIVNLLADSRRN